MFARTKIIAKFETLFFISRNNISFVRLDGTLNQQQREKVLKEFSEDGNILVGVVALP